MSVFEHVFVIVVGEEGGYTTNPADPGNWTGGRCGVGRCVGTRYGISAAAYPALDIARLTLDAAKVIYRRDYWDEVQGEQLPPSLALLVFDAAVNDGVARASRWLQVAVGAAPDGKIGSATLAAVRSHGGRGVALLAEYQAQRLRFQAGLPTWGTFGLGWARRLCALPYKAIAIETAMETAQ